MSAGRGRVRLGRAARLVPVDPGLLARIAVLVVVVAVFAAQRGYFLPDDDLPLLFQSAAVVGLVALGLTAPMLAGELDLSVGSMAALAGVLAVQFHGLGVFGAVLAATGVAAVLGAAQGLAIAALDINSLVFTVGTLIGLRGVAYLTSTDQGPVVLPLDQLQTVPLQLKQPVLRWLTPLSLTAVVAFVLVGLLLAFVRAGREVYAVGGGRAEARAAGVGVRRPLVLAFTLSAACAGLAGALSSYKDGSADPRSFEELLLAGVTAALIGGVSVYGGRGSVLGVAIGVLTLTALLTGMTQLALPTWAQQLATGALLSVFLLVELGGMWAVRLTSRRRTTPGGAAPSLAATSGGASA